MLFTAAVVLLLAWLATSTIREARQAAHDSAHLALWAEIHRELTDRSLQGEYPSGLAELNLQFDDGGSPDLLRLFEYSRTDNGCRLSTVVRGRRRTAQFGRERE